MGIPEVYDADNLRAYWKQRPIKIAERAATLTLEVPPPSQ